MQLLGKFYSGHANLIGFWSVNIAVQHFIPDILSRNDFMEFVMI